MKKFIAFFFLCLVAALFFLRTPLLKGALSIVLPASVTYDKVEWQGGRILLHGLHFQDSAARVHVDHAELSFHPQLKPVYLEMHLSLDQPDVVLLSSEEPAVAFPLFLLQPRRFAGIKLHVNHGVLNLEDETRRERYYFSFASGEEKEAIGRLLLSDDIERLYPPLLQIDLQLEEGGLSASLVTQSMQTSRLFELIEALYPPLLQGWKGKEGTIAMQWGALFSPDFSLRAVSAQFSGQMLYLLHPHLNLEMEAKEFEGKLFLPLFSEENEPPLSELIATFTVKNGTVSRVTPDGTKVAVVRGTDADLAFEPGKEPVFNLQGTLCEEKREWPFLLSGKGEVKEEGTFWTQVELALGTSSLMKAQISFCHPQREEYLLAANFQGMGALELCLLSRWMPTYFHEGILGGKVTAHFKNAHLKQLLFEDVEMRNLSFALPEKKIQGKIGTLVAQGELTHSPQGWEFARLDAHCAEADLQVKHLHLKETELHLSSLANEIESLLFKGNIEGIQAELHLQKEAEPQGGLVGEMVFENTYKIEMECDLMLHPVSSFEELASSLRPKQGWLRSPVFSLSIWNKILKSSYPDIMLEGEADLVGTFDEKGIELSLQTDHLVLHHPVVNLELLHTGEKDPSLVTRKGCATLRYTFASEEFFAEIPISEGRLWEKRQGLDLRKIHGVCSLFAQLGEKQEQKWYLNGKLQGAECSLSPEAKISELDLEIEADTESHTLSLSKGRGILTVQNQATLPLVLTKVSLQNEKGLRGEFDLSLRDETQDALCLSGTIQEEKGNFTLLFNADKSHFYRTKLAGMVVNLGAGGKLHSMDGNFSILGKELALQLKLLKKCGFIHFDPAFVSCDGSLELALHYRDLLSFEVEGKRVRWKEHSFGYISAKGSKKGQEWSVEQLKLDDLSFRGRFSFNKTRLEIPQFECKTHAAQLRGEGSYEEEKKVFVGSLQELYLDLAKLGPSVSAKGGVKGRGKIRLDLSSNQIQGEAQLKLDLREPFALAAVSEKNVHFSYTPKGGVQIKNAEFFLPEKEIHLKAEQISIGSSMEKALIKKAHLTTLVPLFGSTAWEMKDLLFTSGTGCLEVCTETSFQKQPLFLKFTTQPSQSKRAILQISDSQKSEGLKLQGFMDGGWRFENMRGSFAGLDVDLAQSKKQENRLSGSVKVDLRKLSTFFPREGRELVSLLKLGKGYELVGDFVFSKTEKPHFLGKLLGHQFECLGFVFEGFQAQAELSFDQIRLSQFSLNDPGAKAQIKLVKIDKRPTSEQWMLDVPLIQFNDLSPSLLRREKRTLVNAKPLMIKNFSLVDLRGSLNDVTTLSARGHLNFTNSEKKENSFLDLPIQFVKDLGLDPSLLVPVYGEIDLELKGSRFFVKDLRNAYSEAKRCEFFLSEEKPSYIDLNGNIHVDIKMKQNVTLKLVEPFTLKVRGTLEKPKLGI